MNDGLEARLRPACPPRSKQSWPAPASWCWMPTTIWAAPRATARASCYNESVEIGGTDREFHKDGNGHPLPPIRHGPFYAAEVRAAIIGFTAAGLDISADCEVRDTRGRVIRGLYAAGEVVGCFHGKRYAGGGTSIGSLVMLGRRAGTTAAQHALTAPVPA